MKFSELALSKPILRAIEAQGYETATPIQAQAIPHILEGSDVLGSAQTGTGKTAAFALPILHQLAASAPAPAANSAPRPPKKQHRKGNGKRKSNNQRHHDAGPSRVPRCLVLSPTRELAVQIGDSFAAYGKHLNLKHVLVYGGVSQHHQTRALSRGVDIIVATPGRLKDLGQQGYVDLEHIEMFVLDEADRMLDMGFIHDIQRIAAELPEDRQTLLFSATLPPAIQRLSAGMMREPVRINTAPTSSTAERVEQGVYFVDKPQKMQLLTHLLDAMSINRAIVFTRTKHGADKVARQLDKAGHPAAAIHGNKTQNQRQRALNAFRDGKTHLLVATDVAARGIDVDGVTHVFNYDVSNDPESYVHRIGRTARAGNDGLALTFCAPDERGYLKSIQRLIKMDIPVRDDHPEEVPASAPPKKQHKPAGKPFHKNAKPRANGYQKNGKPGGKPGSKPNKFSKDKKRFNAKPYAKRSHSTSDESQPREHKHRDGQPAERSHGDHKPAGKKPGGYKKTGFSKGGAGKPDGPKKGGFSKAGPKSGPKSGPKPGGFKKGGFKKAGPKRQNNKPAGKPGRGAGPR